jgi:hypothetical protein
VAESIPERGRFRQRGAQFVQWGTVRRGSLHDDVAVMVLDADKVLTF